MEEGINTSPEENLSLADVHSIPAMMAKVLSWDVGPSGKINYDAKRDNQYTLLIPSPLLLLSDKLDQNAKENHDIELLNSDHNGECSARA
jgi:hypothetical protein